MRAAQTIPTLFFFATLTTWGASAAADDPPVRREPPPPAGGGTEAGVTHPGEPYRVREGVEAGAALGTGFNSVYGLGVTARVGYSLASGVYLGGAVSSYYGYGEKGATFFGAEGGYKFFPVYRLELRPYGFMGPAWVDRGYGNDAALAFYPGLLTAYHLGQGFLGVDARTHIVPDPAALAILAGGGFNF
jgi:hypothetical protein